MLLVQIYVDDIIFGATNVSLWEEFSKCMYSEFEMSMMGELNFFLGLQIKQLKERTFINQAKYIRNFLKRFNMEEAKTMKTPMSSSIKLDKDEKGKSIDSTMYKGMILCYIWSLVDPTSCIVYAYVLDFNILLKNLI